MAQVVCRGRAGSILGHVPKPARAPEPPALSWPQGSCFTVSPSENVRSQHRFYLDLAIPSLLSGFRRVLPLPAGCPAVAPHRERGEQGWHQQDVPPADKYWERGRRMPLPSKPKAQPSANPTLKFATCHLPSALDSSGTEAIAASSGHLRSPLLHSHTDPTQGMFVGMQVRSFHLQVR